MQGRKGRTCKSATFSWLNVTDVYHITLRVDFLWDKKSHLKGIVFPSFMGCMKNVLSPPLRPSTPRVTHIKQSTGTRDPAYVLTVCTHIICHTALSVIIAWWGHQLPPWKQLCCLMCGMHHSSSLHQPPTTTISQCEEVICHAGKVAHRVPLKHALWTVSLCNELHLADAMCGCLLWIYLSCIHRCNVIRSWESALMLLGGKCLLLHY